MTLLETKAVDYYYQDGDQRRYILKETSVSFEKGTFYAILVQSGSGKTTFLSLISALDSPKSGQVLYEGTDIEKIGHENYRRDDISIIFQSYNLIPYLSAVENVLVPMAITKNQLPDNQREVAYNLLDYIGITKEKADRLVNQLSGGEQQRVSIARAIVNTPKVLIADEPTGNLDPENSWEIMKLLDRINAQGTTVVMATHNSTIVNTIRHRVIAIENGRIIRDQAEGEYGYDD